MKHLMSPDEMGEAQSNFQGKVKIERFTKAYQCAHEILDLKQMSRSKNVFLMWASAPVPSEISDDPFKKWSRTPYSRQVVADAVTILRDKGWNAKFRRTILPTIFWILMLCAPDYRQWLVEFSED